MQLEMLCPHCETWGVISDRCDNCDARMADYEEVPERPRTYEPYEVNVDMRTTTEIQIENFTVTTIDTDQGFAAAVTSYQGGDITSAFAAMMTGNKEITTETAPIVTAEHPYAAAGQAVDAFMMDDGDMEP